MSYEEDTRLRTEDREEDDEKEYEERLGMSLASTNKLQILWDHFIHAEPQSYEVPARHPCLFCITFPRFMLQLVGSDLLGFCHQLAVIRFQGRTKRKILIR